LGGAGVKSLRIQGRRGDSGIVERNARRQTANPHKETARWFPKDFAGVDSRIAASALNAQRFDPGAPNIRSCRDCSCGVAAAERALIP